MANHQKWEYISTTYESAKIRGVLVDFGQLGAQGYELVSVVPMPDNKERAYFKRHYDPSNRPTIMGQPLDDHGAFPIPKLKHS